MLLSPSLARPLSPEVGVSRVQSPTPAQRVTKKIARTMLFACNAGTLSSCCVLAKPATCCAVWSTLGLGLLSGTFLWVCTGMDLIDDPACCYNCCKCNCEEYVVEIREPLIVVRLEAPDRQPADASNSTNTSSQQLIN